MKVVQVLHHSSSADADIRFFEEDWHVKVAKQIVKASDEFEVECWRPHKTFDEEYSRVGDEGITYRIYPSTLLGGLKTYSFEYSLPMLRALREQAKQEEVLFHFHGPYYLHTYVLLTLMEGGEVPIVSQSHGSFPAFTQFNKSSHPLRLFLLLETLPQRIAFKDVDHFFCVHEEEVSELAEFFGAETSLHPMGVDFEKYRPISKGKSREKLGLETEPTFIHYIGRLHEGKGVDILLRSIKKLIEEGHELKLNIAGVGPEKEKLQILSEKLEIDDRVFFLGFVDEDDKTAFYNAADIVVFPSPYEPYGVVPIEALACGTPLVAIDTGVVPEIVGHFGGGYVVVPPGDSDAIARGIKVLLNEENPASRIDREGGRGYHGWDEKIKNILGIYESLEERYWG